MKAALVISSHDNVATALEALEPGRRLRLGTVDVAVLEPIPPGHKVALTSIGQGQPIVKYGSPIGLATVEIPAGAHVHIHNVASTRGRGDLDVLPTATVERLAEPADEEPAPTAAAPAEQEAGLPR